MQSFYCAELHKKNVYVFVSPKLFKMRTAQWIWTCPEDRDDFIITSPCSARGLIKNMWLHSPFSLQIDWVLDSSVFLLLGNVCVCAHAGLILSSQIYFSLSVIHLACFGKLLWVWSDRMEAHKVGEDETPCCLSMCMCVYYTQWDKMANVLRWHFNLAVLLPRWTI